MKRNGGDAVERLLLRQTALILLSSRQHSGKPQDDHSLCSLCLGPPHSGELCSSRLTDAQRHLIAEILT